MELSYETVMSLASDDVAEHTLYALIDHGAIPDLTKRLSRFGVSWTSLFEGSRDEGALEVAPILVRLRFGGQALISKSAVQWICEHARYTSSLLFLLSTLDMPALARRLTLRLDASLPDNVEVVLRYFDCRIFDTLMAVLDGAQRAGFLSVANAWSIVDRAGEIRTYPAGFNEQESELLPLEFTVQQEKLLIELSEPDQVAMLLRSVMPAEFAKLAPAARFDSLTYHIASARTYGITSVQEQALYCSLALTNGARFAEEPKWHEALLNVAASRLTFFDAVNQVG